MAEKKNPSSIYADDDDNDERKWRRTTATIATTTKMTTFRKNKNIKLRSAECWKTKKQKAKSCKTVAYSIYDLHWIEYVLKEASTTAEAKHDENLCYKHQPM